MNNLDQSVFLIAGHYNPLRLTGDIKIGSMNKENLPDSLITPRCIVRRTVREDFSHFSEWPPYEWPYDCYNLSASEGPYSEQSLWWQKIDAPDRCNYSVVHSESGEIIGLHAFVRIDWDNRIAGNMGIRIHPEFCDQGHCRETLTPLLNSVLNSGIIKIRLDVATSNARAVECYQKCGMVIVDEFWLPHEGERIDPNDPKWNFALPHLKKETDSWLTRFYWMEIT